jgi:hypothetical protein
MKPFLFSDVLVLPDDHGYQETLINGWKLLHGDSGLACLIGIDGMVREAAVGSPEYEDYLEGGEWDETVAAYGLDY